MATDLTDVIERALTDELHARGNRDGRGWWALHDSELTDIARAIAAAVEKERK